MQIVNININDIKEYENNAKIHTDEQIEQIVTSIERYGNNDPIAIDENNVIIEGHGRYLALKRLGVEKVPVIKLEHLTEEQKSEYILVHNKLTMNTGFDLDILEQELDKIEFDMTNFDFEKFEQIFEEETSELNKEIELSELEDKVMLKVEFGYDEYQMVLERLHEINEDKRLALLEVLDV